MDAARWNAALTERDRQPLSDYDRDAIRYMGEDRRPYVEIAGAVGRCVGTVSSELFRLRQSGVIARRRGRV